MTKGIALISLLIFALLINASGLPRQQQPPPTSQPASKPEGENEDEVVRITTNLVQVDAVVTDKDGHQVTNLRAEDFEILENKQPRQVTNFSYVTTAQPTRAATDASTFPAPKRDRNVPPVPPVRLRPEQVRRTIALVIDDLMMSGASLNVARSSLRKYVDEQIQPGDLVAIIRTSAGIGALQQFTSDKRQLYAAIERVRWSPRFGGKQTPFESTIGADTPGAIPGGVDAPRTSLKDYDEYRQEIFTVASLGTLRYVVSGLREMSGRKAVIYFSDGFFLRDSKGDTTRYLSTLDRLTDLANRSSVVFYTIDTRGLQPTGPTAADDTAGSPLAPGDNQPLNGITGIKTWEVGQRLLSARSAHLFEGQGGLKLMAERTGGTALINQNDLGKGIRRALDDMSGYYLIGYRPDDTAFDPATGRVRFNSLVVKVKNRPDLRVRSRSGYIGIADNAARTPTQPRTRAGQMMAALLSPFGAGGVNLRLTSFFIGVEGGAPAMRSMLQLDPHTLTFEKEANGDYKTNIDIIAVTFGVDGSVVDQINRIETIHVQPESFQRFMKQGMVYDLYVPVKRPGAYQLRVAVRDTATERVGSASQFVEVPDLSKERLALSGLVVASPQPQVTSGAQRADALADDVQADPATRRFRRGALLDYGFVIYNARLEGATRRSHLMIQARLFRDGQQVYSGAPQPFDPNKQTGLEMIEAAGRLQLGSELQPGEYILQIVVTDAPAGKTQRIATQWTDIEVVG